MKKYTELEVVDVLKAKVKHRGITQVALDLGFSKVWIRGTMSGALPLSEKTAMSLGFKQLPDAYIRQKEQR